MIFMVINRSTTDITDHTDYLVTTENTEYTELLICLTLAMETAVPGR